MLCVGAKQKKKLIKNLTPLCMRGNSELSHLLLTFVPDVSRKRRQGAKGPPPFFFPSRRPFQAQGTVLAYPLPPRLPSVGSSPGDVMEQYDLQDWEILQGPDPIPDVAAVVTSGGDFDYFDVGSGERDLGRGGGESGFEVEQGGLGKKGEGDFQAGRGGLDVLPADGSERSESGIEVGVHGEEEPMEDFLGLGGMGVEVGVEEESSGVAGLGGGNKEKGSDPMEISLRGQSEIGLDGVESSGGCSEKVEETDEGSDLGRSVAEVGDDTNVIGTIEEIEANTGRSDWDFAHSSNEVAEPEFTEESNEEISKQGIVSGGDGNKSEVVWWKFPLELVKFCAFNVKPVWTISMAAAMVGFALIGRRWYNIRRRRRGIPVKLDINDKKASQAVTRAARLNEAFSLVKRVPLLKTSIPNDGKTPWPAMALI